LGYVSEFLEQPELQSKGWRSRLPLEDLVHGNSWGQPIAHRKLKKHLAGG
ncbi:MAG TPA: 5,6-dimethylbenzimidazole synthase, partial [Marinobacter sp.]|nr:5,6-dimethylbenzimidazole synthase [Marinobacter sp.]